MKITEIAVKVGRTTNIGNYESIKNEVEMTALLGKEEEFEDQLQDLYMMAQFELRHNIKRSLASLRDLHAHPFKNGTITEEGRNSRVDDAVGVIRQVYSYAKNNNVAYVLFGGDLFDRRKSIDVDTFNRIHEVISEGADSIPTIMIPGNHDQANKSGTIHALDRFSSDKCKVFHQPEWVELDVGVGLFGVPYVDDGEVIAASVQRGLSERPEWAKKAFLLLHYGIQGARVSAADYVLPCELELSHLSPSSWNLILSGHYHIGQQLGSNFHYIGSAMQHRWDDAGFEKSFIEFDTESWSIRRIPTVAPRFVVVPGKTKDYDVKNSFVRIVRNYEIEEKKRLSINERLKARGAISIEYRIESENVKDYSERIEFSKGNGLLGILEDYIKADIIDVGTLDADKLFTLGKELITQAQNAQDN
mgnify:CR=1 FL=1